LDAAAAGCIRPYAVASSTLTGGSVGAVACAGNTNFTSPAVLVLNLGSGSSFNARYAIPFADGLVPDAIACTSAVAPATVVLCFAATSFGNSVVVVDPPSGRSKLRRMPAIHLDPAIQAAEALAVDQHHPLYP
jgi:hypothetical protein